MNKVIKKKKNNKKRSNTVRVVKNNKVEKPKEENEIKLKKIDKESYYKKYFSGRFSIPHQIQEEAPPSVKIETRTIGIQV